MNNKILWLKFKNSIFWQPFKFVVSGSVASLTALFSLFILVSGLGLWPVFGSLIANTLSGSVGFIFNKYWTYANKSTDWGEQAFYYCLLVIFNVLVSAFLMYLLNDVLGIWYLADQVAIIFIMMSFNFCTGKFFIFRHKKNNLLS